MNTGEYRYSLFRLCCGSAGEFGSGC